MIQWNKDEDELAESEHPTLDVLVLVDATANADKWKALPTLMESILIREQSYEC